MTNRRSILALCVVVLGLMFAATGDARGNINRTTFLTFSGPVALPGVTLEAGTYIFELADPERSLNIVQVLSRNRTKTHLITLTNDVERPKNLQADRQVLFGEASAGAPLPITAWFPVGDAVGHGFIYR